MAGVSFSSKSCASCTATGAPVALPLSSCNTPTPSSLFTSLNLGIPDCGTPFACERAIAGYDRIECWITFSRPQAAQFGCQQKIQPGQHSNLEQFANRIGISDGTYQKIKGFFNLSGIALKLSKLRTHLGIRAKASTLAKVLQTKFVIHQYKNRTFYAPATPPKVPTFLANSIDAITGS